jgi:hypothetical protein
VKLLVAPFRRHNRQRSTRAQSGVTISRQSCRHAREWVSRPRVIKHHGVDAGLAARAWCHNE